jgi:hypothetical protein
VEEIWERGRGRGAADRVGFVLLDMRAWMESMTKDVENMLRESRIL